MSNDPLLHAIVHNFSKLKTALHADQVKHGDSAGQMVALDAILALAEGVVADIRLITNSLDTIAIDLSRRP